MARAAGSAATAPLTIPNVSVLAVAGATIEKIAGGALRAVVDGDALKLQLGEWAYALSGQPVLRTSPTAYVLPGTGTASAQQFVLSFAASTAPAVLAAFDELVARSAQLRRGLSDGRADGRSGAASTASAVAAAPALAGSETAIVAAPAGAASSVTAAGPETGPSLTATVGSAVATGVVFTGKVVAQGLVYGAELGGAGAKW